MSSLNDLIRSLPSLIPPFAAFLSLIGFRYFPYKKAWVFVLAVLLISGIGLFLLSVSSGIFYVNFLLTLLCVSGPAFFMLIFSGIEGEKLNRWVRGLKNMENRRLDREKEREALKTESKKMERDIVRNLRLYGAIKGMAEALTWDEMIPHIDFAVQQCLGLNDYQLYLSEEKNPNPEGASEELSFKKVISRGTRMLEAPLHSLSQQVHLHPKSNDSYLEVPVYHRSAQIAVLWARIPAEMQLLSNQLMAESLDLSEELGMGLQKALFFSALEKLSRIDGLTGVYRRQVFNDRLNEEIYRTRVFRTVFSVLIADLDHFKQINDTYGHQAGDEVLRRVGEIFKESVYETDFVARYGGEEFVVLFPQADPAGVRRKAETIREKIGQAVFTLGWNKVQITVSLGIAHFPKDGTDPTSLLSKADQCLYQAKNNGRNRAVDSSEV